MAPFKGKIGKISMKSCHEVEWSIDDFCSYTVEDDYFESKRFTISDSKWYLQVFPNGHTAKELESVGWISLYVMRDDGDKSPPISARYLLGVKKVDGSFEHLHRKKPWVFEKDGVGYGYPQFLKRSELLQRQSELLASGTLTLTCTLWTGTHFGHSGKLDALTRNLADLLISKKGSDATLLVKGKEFPVHRLILSARSPVLAAMFEADMKEKRTGLVEIEDCDPETFKEFLTFLYSGNVENASCDAFELYRIADKYDVEDLKPECLLSIMTNLSIENVLEAAILGSQFNEQQLMSKVKGFFKENFDEIISSTKWDDGFLSENATLANKLLKAMAKKK